MNPAEPFRYISEAEFKALSLHDQHRYLIAAHKQLEAEATLLRSLAATLADDKKTSE